MRRSAIATPVDFMPPERNSIYMSVVRMFSVVPMLIQNHTTLHVQTHPCRMKP